MKPLLIAALLLLSGCATTQDKSYLAYLSAAQAQQEKPVFQLSCPPAGCVVADLKVFNQATNNIQPPVPERSTTEIVVDKLFQIVGLGTQIYGIRANKDVAITQSNNASATTIAGYQAFGTIAQSGNESNVAIAGKIGTPNVTTTTTTTTNTNSNNTTRNCTGGAANATGTTTSGAATTGATAC